MGLYSLPLGNVSLDSKTVLDVDSNFSRLVLNSRENLRMAIIDYNLP